jgi:hypothetical protein
MVNYMGLDLCIFQMAQYIQDLFYLTKQQDKVDIFILMDLIMKDKLKEI